MNDRDLAVELLSELCEIPEDDLLVTPHIDECLRNAMPTHFQTLEPIIRRMMTSSLFDVRVGGARQACLAGFGLDSASHLIPECMSGDEAQRIGLAQVAAANLRTARFRSKCEATLISLFHDPSERVRVEAASCFDGFLGDQLGEFPELVNSFLNSPAFESGHDALVQALDDTTAKLPEAVADLCERFIQGSQEASGDIQTRDAFHARTLTGLLIRVYSQSDDEPFQTRCLDILDQMVHAGSLGLDEALGSFDR